MERALCAFAVEEPTQINAGVQYSQRRNQEEKTGAQGKALAIGSDEVPLPPNAQTVVGHNNRQQQNHPVVLPKTKLHGQDNSHGNAGDVGKVGRQRHGVLNTFRHKSRLIGRQKRQQDGDSP